jgi:hypothetical protein
MQIWDMVLVVLLLYTAFYTTYEVAFEVQHDVLFIIDILVTTCVALDICIHFNLEYVSKISGVVVRKRWGSNGIVWHYCTICVDRFGWISSLDDAVGTFWNWQCGTTTRLIRLLRLTKLLRLIRANKVANTVTKELNFQMSTCYDYYTVVNGTKVRARITNAK